MNQNSSALKTRVVTALALTGALVGMQLLALTACVFALIFLGLLLIVVCLCAVEFGLLAETPRDLIRRNYVALSVIVAALSVPALLVAFVLYGRLCEVTPPALNSTVAILPLGLLITAVASLGLMVVAGTSSLESAVQRLGELFVGSYLIGVGGAAFVVLPFTNGSWWWWMLFVVCFNDIAAYFVGRKVGGPKLSPLLSPGKTVSGALGGLCFGIATGVVGAFVFRLDLPILSAVIVSGAIVIAAQLGDLSKSLVKRLHGAKDSGSILPGHGGFLDRLDGVFAAAPIVMAFILTRLG